jgi:hypothetical protein
VTAVGAGTATITVATGTGSATVDVTVIGHAGVSPVGSVQVNGRPRHIATAGNSAYVATNTSATVVAIDVANRAIAWIDTLDNPVVDVAVNAANTTLVAAGVGGADGPQLYIISTATHKVVDSVALAATPAFVAMNAAGTRAWVNETDFGLEIIDLTTKSVTARTLIPGTTVMMRLAPNEANIYALTRLGSLFEINAATGATRRSFSTSTTVQDFDVSPDNKTAVVSDGTQQVQVIALASGGLNGPVIDFAVGAPVTGVRFTPDGKQLWVTRIASVYAYEPDVGNIEPSIVAGFATVAGASFSKIAFLPSGAAAIILDENGFNLVFFK